MATQLAYPPYAQNRGTLTPGQFVSVNKYNVQVERFLSQGGFAHVYLVRTETPVYNTTHHVLKRIAASNDAMVAEVRKEVNIMRQLQGHPNIVHIIDAAWHRMSNGFFEVFILMELCPGGGIIDMMNRRLRERLTEAEILQIFVDVCEGVAAMHSKQPPLIHRDLKVENILQSSPTAYKLCDFGSATRVAPRPPATVKEIIELEADLNRHTTLQYRAPEMVDSYLRRPVDEKSDVWALGVLLYKLCYYTTPFEEHGPLAILNVQYRTPSYPVYSAQMNSMIASMLREHGTQRPSVFELLTIVHGLRGTKSPFQYTIPSPQPLSARHPQPQPQFQSQIKAQPQLPRRQRSNSISLTNSPPPQNVNAGVQAREKVLEAIAPMRRGRPSLSKGIRPSSPQKLSETGQVRDKNEELGANWNGKFDADDDKAWSTVIGESSVGFSGPGNSEKTNDPWILKEAGKKPTAAEQAQSGPNFEENLWDSFDPSITSTSGSVSSSKPSTPSHRPPEPARIKSSPAINVVNLKSKNKDAFDDLGLDLGGRNRPPTLGEARKLRTGLAVMSTTMANGYNDSSSQNNSQSTPSNQIAPSPRPSYLSPTKPHTLSQSQPHSTASSIPSSPRKLPAVPQPNSRTHLDGLSAEARFPSLEALDASFAAGSLFHVSPKPKVQQRLPQPPAQPSGGEPRTGGLRPIGQTQHHRSHDGVRSQQVTGVAMRDLNQNKKAAEPYVEVSQTKQGEVSRPTLMRKHRSSISIKPNSQSILTDASNSRLPLQTSLAPPFVTIPSSHSPPRLPPKEWLAGVDSNSVSPTLASAGSPASTTSEIPGLRGSPGKRASFIEKNTLPTPQEAVLISRDDFIPSAATQARNFPAPTAVDAKPKFTIMSIPRTVPSANTSHSAFFKNDTPHVFSENKQSESGKEIDSSSDEGPEDVSGYIPTPSKATENRGLEQRKGRTGKGRQNSVHDLVGLWGGTGVTSNNTNTQMGIDTQARKRQSTTTPSSSSSTQVASRAIVGSASQPVLSPPADSRPISRSLKQPSPDSGRYTKQPSIADSIQSPVSARSRPQSAFLLPLPKANSDDAVSSVGFPGGPASPGLSPVDDSRPREGIRRTSISEMVQHYEALGGKTKLSSSPVSKPPMFKASPRQTDSNRYSKVQPGNAPVISRRDQNVTMIPGSELSTPKKPLASSGDHKKTRTVTDARIPDPAVLRTSPIGYLDLERPKGRQSPVPSPQIPTRKRETVSSASSSDLSGTPSRKSTLSDEATKTNDRRSPSPERPYQGVGKLIDQWQRKTAEAESPRRPTNRRARV